MGHRTKLAAYVRWAVLWAVCLGAAPARAETTVPFDLQVELIRKVVRFERGFAGRSGPTVQVLIFVRAGSAESEKAAEQLAKALVAVREMAGKPIQVSAHAYRSPAALRKLVVDEAAPLVYLAPGLDGEVARVAAALDGVPAITIASDGDLVDQGAILGFNLVAARPRISLNLGQARRQRLDFNSDLFRLTRLVK